MSNASAATRREDTEWFRGRAGRLTTLLEELSSAEVEQFAEHEGTCDMCGCPYYGILDESKLRLPLEGLIQRYNRWIQLRFQNVSLIRGLAGGYSSAYEVRQDIVRSGMFSRMQLQPSGLFSQHELEVNDKAFTDIRPKRCDCNFGSEPEFTEEELLALAVAEAADLEDVLHDVEVNFVDNKPIRTGFRVRSKSALKRRRERLRAKKRSKLFVYPSVSILGFHLPKGEVPLSFKTEIKKRGRKPSKYRGNYPGDHARRRRTRKESINRIYNLAPKPGQTKYWYFVRKRGGFTLSVHHPLKGD